MVLCFDRKSLRPAQQLWSVNRLVKCSSALICIGQSLHTNPTSSLNKLFTCRKATGFLLVRNLSRKLLCEEGQDLDLEIALFLCMDVNRQVVTGSLVCLLSLFSEQLWELEKLLVVENLENSYFSLLIGGFQLWLEKEPAWERVGKQTFVSAGEGSQS